MMQFLSRGTTTLVLSMLGILGMVSLSSAKAETFQASGQYVDTNVEPNTTKGKVAGEATPGGEFVGHYWHRKSFDGPTMADGRATLDFGNGDTLTIDYVFVYNPAAGVYLGTFVVRHGTGALKNATGGGNIAVTPPVELQGLFWLDGDIFLE